MYNIFHDYDYIFNVEMDDNVTLKLPFNQDDNPIEAAEKFLARE